MIRKFPNSLASSVDAPTGEKLFAPSAARNASVVVELVADFAPDAGEALEIASGTGQHVVQLARRLPGLLWQPTDPDPTRRQSINAYTAESELSNIAPAQALDAARDGWHRDWPGQSLIFLCNLLHLISESEANTVLTEGAQALSPGGRFIIYGPFRRSGELTSEGDIAFDANLRANDPEVGYKDDFDTIEHLQHNGLTFVAAVEMPANNLAIIVEKA